MPFTPQFSPPPPWSVTPPPSSHATYDATEREVRIAGLVVRELDERYPDFISSENEVLYMGYVIPYIWQSKSFMING
jgi:hypothetical protein